MMVDNYTRLFTIIYSKNKYLKTLGDFNLYDRKYIFGKLRIKLEFFNLWQSFGNNLTYFFTRNYLLKYILKRHFLFYFSI